MVENSFSFPTARLVCIDSSQIEGQPTGVEIKLDNENEKIVGREEGCQVFLDSKKLSRKHARIFLKNGRWGIEDLNSANGVFINGQRKELVFPEHGDEIKFGIISFEFLLDNPKQEIADVPVEEPLDSAIKTVESDIDDDGDETVMFGALDAQVAMLRTSYTKREASVRSVKLKLVITFIAFTAVCYAIGLFMFERGFL